LSHCSENLGESELREALLKKAEYLATIGDKAAAIEVREDTPSLVTAPRTTRCHRRT